jgi:hypothetical protein
MVYNSYKPIPSKILNKNNSVIAEDPLSVQMFFKKNVRYLFFYELN